MQNHVTSLITSKRLKDHGVTQRGAMFFWVPNLDDDDSHIIYAPVTESLVFNDYVRAFMSTEIGEQLAGFGDWICYRSKDGVNVRLILDDGGMVDADNSPNEADGRGQVLASLLDRNIIKLKGDDDGSAV